MYFELVSVTVMFVDKFKKVRQTTSFKVTEFANCVCTKVF